MNYIDNVFKMLGVQPGEEFKLAAEEYIYRFDGQLYLYFKIRQDSWNASKFTLHDIITGKVKIIKIPKISKGAQTVIDYAKLCGFNYLAKDSSGDVFAFKCKPYKLGHDWVVEPFTPYTKVYHPVSFLSWEDEEPYYIGGDNNANKTE